MKSLALSNLIRGIALALPLAASLQAAVINLAPTPSDLYDLDHNSAYKWNIRTPSLQGQTITGATLSFDNIRDWTTEQNVLYVQLMNSGSWDNNIVTTFTDSEASGNYFAQNSYFGGSLLAQYNNLPAAPQDLTYIFTNAQLAILTTYINDGDNGFFALGFDPDCHFFNDGIKLTITTADVPPPAVPEPGTLALFGLGAVFAGFAVRRKKV
jgi:hypothetical protein